MALQLKTRPKNPAGGAALVKTETARAKSVTARDTVAKPGKILGSAGKVDRPIAVAVQKRVRLLGIKKARQRSFAVQVYEVSDFDRVHLIRRGVPATLLTELSTEMEMPRERLYSALRLPRSTVDRKIRDKALLSPEHSERVIGLERLIGQVEALVNQSGDPEGFDASRWVGEWLEYPLPALGGAKPGDYMDTIEGQQLISRLLSQVQSGAYA